MILLHISVSIICVYHFETKHVSCKLLMRYPHSKHWTTQPKLPDVFTTSKRNGKKLLAEYWFTLWWPSKWLTQKHDQYFSLKLFDILQIDTIFTIYIKGKECVFHAGVFYKTVVLEQAMPIWSLKFFHLFINGCLNLCEAYFCYLTPIKWIVVFRYSR